MHTPDLLGWVKRSDIEILQLSIYLIELSELIGFDYDLSDTQDGLRCWRNGIYILWLTSFPVTRIQVSFPGPKGPLVLNLDQMFFKDFIFFQLWWAFCSTEQNRLGNLVEGFWRKICLKF